MRLLFQLFLITILVPTAVFAQKAKLQLHFDFQCNDKPLVLDNDSLRYENALGQKFSITKFKYYISNIALINEKGEKISVPNSYYLIDADDSDTWQRESSSIPVGKYKSISFIIGVDSLHNVSGPQEGELDPANGMFWTWNNGYIFVKMEGFSPQSGDKLHRLTFHVGGIQPLTNSIRYFNYTFPTIWNISQNKQNDLYLTAHVDGMFKGINTIDFHSIYETTGDKKSPLIADNCAANLFTVKTADK